MQITNDKEVNYLKGINYHNIIVNLKNEIFDPFNKRYPNIEQKFEKTNDLINLVNHKMNLSLQRKNVIFLLYHYLTILNEEKYHNALFSQQNNEISNNVEFLAKTFIKVLSFIPYVGLLPSNKFYLTIDNITWYYDLFDGSDRIKVSANSSSDEGIFDHKKQQFYKYLYKININFDETLLEKEIDRLYKLTQAEQFEKKLKQDFDNKSILDEIENLDGFEFESFISELFEKDGYKVNLTKKTGDQGADIIIEKDGISIAVQTKKYQGSVGNKAIQEVVAAMKYYDCDKAMVITTGTFTRSAYELANINEVELIDGDGLKNLIDEIY